MNKLMILAIICLNSVLGTEVSQDSVPHEPVHIAGEHHIDRGFTARKAIVKGPYIGFEKLVHNINVGPNNFNLEYGFFRAEKSGMHHFTFQLISAEVPLRVSLRVNGRPMVWAWGQPNYRQVGNSATLALQTGDVVYLYLENGQIFERTDTYRGFGTFTGHRLAYDETEAVVPRTSSRLTEAEKKEIDPYGEHLPANW